MRRAIKRFLSRRFRFKTRLLAGPDRDVRLLNILMLSPAEPPMSSVSSASILIRVNVFARD